MKTVKRSILVGVALGALAGCSDPESCRIETTAAGQRMVCPDGSSSPLGGSGGCTVIEGEAGAAIVRCPDGSETVIPAPSKGRDGSDGKDGGDGQNGRDGVDGDNGRDGKDGAHGEDGSDGKDGSDGADGKDGATVLVRLVDLPAGAECPGGGVAVYAGLDLDGDGILDLQTEATSREVVCSGLPGKDGTDGGDGQPGAPGRDGTDGKTALLRLDPEAAGPNCTYGGTAVRSGLDLDGDGALSDDEVTATHYLCNSPAYVLGVDFGDLRFLESGSRNHVTIRAMLGGAFDPLRRLRWRLQVTDDLGAPIAGLAIYLPPPPGEVAGSAGGAGGAGGAGDAGDAGGEAGAGGAGGAAGAGAPDVDTWTDFVTTDPQGFAILRSGFTVREDGLDSYDGATLDLGLEIPAPGAYRLRLVIEDIRTGEVIADRASEELAAAPLTTLVYFSDFEDLHPNTPGVGTVLGRLDRTTAPDTPVRWRYRLTSRGAPVVGAELGFPEAGEEGLPATSWTGTIALDGQGEGWLGAAAGFPASELQVIGGVARRVRVDLPAGDYLLEAEVVAVAAGAPIAHGSQAFTLQELGSTIQLSVDEAILAGQRSLLAVALSTASTYASSETFHLHLRWTDRAGAGAAGLSIFRGPPGADPNGHAGWTDVVRTDAAGEAIYPVALTAAELQSPSRYWLFLSLEPPRVGRFALSASLVRDADGQVIAEAPVVEVEVDP
ncbi:DUF7151 family protein [Vulgatibacter incomptus]|uniref:DUF7151 domain-containing protein n=1 Tax=Vulgatibacter incomptus TaxID=1391653 RepID=A0A0K1PGE8_9BACT|nr:hypothetical protein [Vulgatibacter incomptus]AKU92179.1 hypothetical protein AKJ08_2566 [Vulgatibacter incomptus]